MGPAQLITIVENHKLNCTHQEISRLSKARQGKARQNTGHHDHKLYATALGYHRGRVFPAQGCKANSLLVDRASKERNKREKKRCIVWPIKVSGKHGVRYPAFPVLHCNREARIWFADLLARRVINIPGLGPVAVAGRRDIEFGKRNKLERYMW